MFIYIAVITSNLGGILDFLFLFLVFTICGQSGISLSYDRARFFIISLVMLLHFFWAFQKIS